MRGLPGLLDRRYRCVTVLSVEFERELTNYITTPTAPFDIRLNDAANNFVEEVGSNVQSSPFQWTVNEPAGQEFALVLLDSTGATGLSGQFTIQTSSNTACLSASASTGGSSTAAASGASTAAASATSGASSGTSFVRFSALDS